MSHLFGTRRNVGFGDAAVFLGCKDGSAPGWRAGSSGLFRVVPDAALAPDR
jgi:hypothetical protein